MNKVLSVATAGLRNDQLKDVHHLKYPRVDYLELQGILDSDLIDYSAYERALAGGFFRQLEREIRTDTYLTAISWWKSRNYSTVFTWSERAGIPFAGLRSIMPTRARFVTMFQSWSDRQKTALTKFDCIIDMKEMKVRPAQKKVLPKCVG